MLIKEYQVGLSSINIKKISSFKSLKNPTNSEKNIGISFLLLMSYIDSSIALTNDKSTLSDKSWIGSITRYFNNSGKVM